MLNRISTTVLDIPDGKVRNAQLQELADGSWVIAWVDVNKNPDSEFNNEVFSGTFHSETGQITEIIQHSEDLQFFANSYDPILTALDDGGFALSWQLNDLCNYGYSQYIVIEDAAGQARDGPIAIFSAISLASGADILQLSNGNLIVTNPNDGVFFPSHRLVDLNGSIDKSFPLHIQGLDHVFFVQHTAFAWQDGYRVIWNHDDGALNTLRMTTYDAAGTVLGFADLTDIPNGSNINHINAVILPDGAVAVVWTQGIFRDPHEKMVQVFEADGSARSGAVSLGVGGYTQWEFPIIALDDGGFAVLVPGNEAQNLEPILSVFDANGTLLGSRIVIPDRELPEGVEIRMPTDLEQLEDGTFVVMWEDVRRFGAPMQSNVIGVLLDDIAGTRQDDVLTGTEGAQILLGYDGNDSLMGGAGDTLVGSWGDDWMEGLGTNIAFHGDEGTDTVSYATASQRASLDLLNTALAFGAARGHTWDSVEVFELSNFNDVFRGSQQADIAHGGRFSDRLYGRRGDDVLDGGIGADALYGNLGADTLTGGDDDLRDRFIYFRAADSTPDARDLITDFTPGEDRIEISRIDADTTQRFKQGFTFIGDAAFGNIAGELRFEQIGGSTLVQADRDGDGLADFEIELLGTLTLQASDFLL